ncbi:MAG: NAD(P)-dependent oxidoreductase, partial [Actinomycetota bacterium]
GFLSSPATRPSATSTWATGACPCQNEALLAALDAGSIGGAAIDVTDPEPLPDDHPLWRHPRALITPHIANTPEMGVPLLAAHIRRNVAAFVAGEPLEGVVDVDAGY